jgi:hypothetical protein
VDGCYVSRKEALGSIKYKELHNQLKKNLALKKGSVPWSQLMDAENEVSISKFKDCNHHTISTEYFGSDCTYIPTYQHLHTHTDTCI